jgi:hypothetical protein
VVSELTDLRVGKRVSYTGSIPLYQEGQFSKNNLRVSSFTPMLIWVDVRDHEGWKIGGFGDVPCKFVDFESPV